MRTTEPGARRAPHLTPLAMGSFLTALLASATACAEEPAALDAIVVTGRRTAARLEDTPQRVEDIERTPTRELADLLKKNASVDVIQYPGNLSGVGIRGFRPEFSGINKRWLPLIDGRPAMSTNPSLVNLDQIERIEVLKGPASALYGAQAMGGVVNLITRESHSGVAGTGQISLGEFDLKELRGRIGGSLSDALDFDYAGSWFDRGDFSAGQGVERPNTAYRQQNHALRLGLAPALDWRLRAKTDLYRGRDIATPGDIAYGLNPAHARSLS